MSGQLGFGDHLAAEGRSRRADRLSEIAAVFDWRGVEALLSGLRSGRMGRPPYSPLVLFRTLLLQRWYGLSDEALEDALADRLSFRRFCGLTLEDAIPDASTVCRFRCALAQAQDGAGGSLMEAVFAETCRALDARGLMVRQGTLIDASLMASAAAEPRKQKGGGRSRVDPEAVWAKKGAKAVFGYKLHVAVDQGSGLVREARVTSANVADCVVGPDLVQGDEAAVYADMAYDSATMRERLIQAGAANRVMTRPNRHHRLTPDQIDRNTAIGRVRGRVEAVFGTLKRSYRRHRLIYHGLGKARADLLLVLMAMNLKRAVVLSAA